MPWNLHAALPVCLDCGPQRRGRQSGPSVSGLAAVLVGGFQVGEATGWIRKGGRVSGENCVGRDGKVGRRGVGGQGSWLAYGLCCQREDGS